MRALISLAHLSEGGVRLDAVGFVRMCDRFNLSIIFLNAINVCETLHDGSTCWA